MTNIRVNGVDFRGQFGEAYKLFQEGETITIGNFHNGGWVPTSKVFHFMDLLNKAGIKYNNTGKSLNTASITKLD